MAGRHHERRKSIIKLDEDFEEEDIWSVSVMKERDIVTSPNTRKSKNYLYSYNSSSCSGSSSASLMIPKAKNGTSASTHEAGQVVLHQSSAPVNIPDWSKIYGKNSFGGHDDNYNYEDNENEEENDFDDGDMLPPHEWLARKLERSQISSFSVCEGIGRTLKGRDLSKVRNSILTRTGFLE